MYQYLFITYSNWKKTQLELNFFLALIRDDKSQQDLQLIYN